MNSTKSIMIDISSDVLDQENLDKLVALNNDRVLTVINQFVSVCKPSKVTVITDSKEDLDYVKKKSIELKEEIPLKLKGHTIHFDSIYDLARDVSSTKVLVPKGEYASPWVNTIDRDEGLKEILSYMDGCMEGKECLVQFFCLGPKDSKFTIYALQITDSFYVVHSENILYRQGYEAFKNLNGSADFFRFIHSAGELTGDPPVTKNISKRRIYIDLKESCVLSCHNQYAGNSVGLKKLALRLAIYRSNNEDWLAEHYFIMGIHPVNKNRVSYFCGGYPSATGKTSTAMIPGQTIVGDDIAYVRSYNDIDGYAHAANIEQGIFGIIQDVNQKDDPVIFDALTTPRETIFSNVLIVNGTPYWLGDKRPAPQKGINFSGEWYQGKKDEKGEEIKYAHPNARYTINLRELKNLDPTLDEIDGVPVRGIFYGGRDSDTMVPVLESLNWDEGVFFGAIIESETTTATIGQTGVRKPNPMANLDFMVVPLNKYIANHRKFGNSLKNPPKVYAMNYFLKNPEGKYLNGMLDKKIWIMWAEGRTYSEYKAIKTPIGYIPLYKDLKALFQQYLNKDYTEKEYVEQFSIRTKHLLDKMDRIEQFYKKEQETPEFFWKILNRWRVELKKLKEKHGKEIISPLELV